ncbi:hypothetical protein E0I74_27880 [Rhizobium laguerreae]|nr:hypothetical protein [Rhizobium laguerreae]NKM19831.1 hypothetical protein [Rhizobium laguerreae]NKM34731.1 hypothetical protein [Rhizobium laguerreae]NKM42554.1 hypothetical protein [Rhizobium laguerreae]NKM85446.1 hypothetical protein [Rhizobium laguerreae]
MSGSCRWLPLTLTLSPVKTGRGDSAKRSVEVEVEEDGAAYPFAPFTGRRWRQPDEGQVPAISWADNVS